MKKLGAIALGLLLLCAACQKEPQEQGAPPTTGSQGQSGNNTQAAGQTYTGRVEDIKDWMITLKAPEDEMAYVFGTEDVDLSAIGLGDTVRVTYTGQLDDVDSSLAATAIEKVEP